MLTTCITIRHGLVVCLLVIVLCLSVLCRLLFVDWMLFLCVQFFRSISLDLFLSLSVKMVEEVLVAPLWCVRRATCDGGFGDVNHKHADNRMFDRARLAHSTL